MNNHASGLSRPATDNDFLFTSWNLHGVDTINTRVAHDIFGWTSIAHFGSSGRGALQGTDPDGVVRDVPDFYHGGKHKTFDILPKLKEYFANFDLKVEFYARNDRDAPTEVRRYHAQIVLVPAKKGAAKQLFEAVGSTLEEVLCGVALLAIREG